ncbi:MAG: OmpA family protein [Bacteroidales bacterium]|jgi:outer membrane protein OmpA-like peptidoglycan-associated protein|nr:OmpA family protein [Bacteroidales bacterium]
MKLTITIFLLFTNFCLFAQQQLSTKNPRAEAVYLDALTYYDNGMLEKAENYLRRAIAMDRKFIEAWLVLAELYENIDQPDSAAIAYTTAMQINPDVHPVALLQLAQIEFQQGKYQDAKKHIEQYKLYPTKSQNTNQRIQILDDKLTFAFAMLADSLPFNPQNMGDSINTAFSEYFPTLTVDSKQLIFTRRNEFAHPQNFGIIYNEDFYYSNFDDSCRCWRKAERFPEFINTNGNEGTQSISPDGRYMYFAACNRKDGFGNCDIYFAKKVGDKWGQPHNLWKPVNSEHWESQPSIAPDGRTLFFASTRPEGSRGGSDIWMSQLNDDGTWSKPINLGDSINTAGNENSPFIHFDGKTLYFSSDRHKGMGGKDLFYSHLKNDGTWSTPVNLGYPINTNRDEVSLFVAANGKQAFFASDRANIRNNGKLDIYTFELAEELRPKPVTYMKGRLVAENDKQPIVGKFEIINTRTNEVVAAALSDLQTGDFMVTLPTEENYAINVSKDGYLFYSENFEVGGISDSIKPIAMDIPLKKIEIGATVVLNNIFFDVNKYNLKEESFAELEKVYDLLFKNPNIKVEISGHTDNTGNRKLNVELSQNRAKAIYDYLIDRQINPERLTYKGYADDAPVASNDSLEGRALNRRTEMTIVGK